MQQLTGHVQLVQYVVNLSSVARRIPDRQFAFATSNPRPDPGETEREAKHVPDKSAHLIEARRGQWSPDRDQTLTQVSFGGSVVNLKIWK